MEINKASVLTKELFEKISGGMDIRENLRATHTPEETNVEYMVRVEASMVHIAYQFFPRGLTDDQFMIYANQFGYHAMEDTDFLKATKVAIQSRVN